MGFGDIHHSGFRAQNCSSLIVKTEFLLHGKFSGLESAQPFLLMAGMCGNHMSRSGLKIFTGVQDLDYGLVSINLPAHAWFDWMSRVHLMEADIYFLYQQIRFSLLTGFVNNFDFPDGCFNGTALHMIILTMHSN